MKVLAIFLALVAILCGVILVVGVVVQIMNPTVSVSAIIVGAVIYAAFTYLFYWLSSLAHKKYLANKQ